MTIDRNGNITVRVDIQDMTYGISVDDAIVKLQEAAKGLANPSLNIEPYESYGSTSCEVYVEGKRKATPEERKVEREKQAMSAAQIRAMQDNQIENLKKVRPEVFK